MPNLGYVDGRNVSIEWRYPDQPAQPAALAAEFRAARADVIVASTSGPLAAAPSDLTRADH